MTAAFTAGYEAGKKEGYSDGYEKGEVRGWEEGREAAAEELGQMAAELLATAKRFESPFISNAMAGQAEAYRLGAAAIRKLEKERPCRNKAVL